jgi:hypothetical protein
MKQQQKEDEIKLLSLQQRQSTHPSNEEATIPTKESGTASIAGSTDDATNAPNIQIAMDHPPVDAFESSAIDLTTTSNLHSRNGPVSPTTTTFAGVVVDDCHSNAQLPIENVPEHGTELNESTEGSLLFATAASTSPTLCKSKPVLDVATPTSTSSNVVDLDVSYDFENDHEESTIHVKMDTSHPVSVDTMSLDDHGKSIAESDTMSPSDTKAMDSIDSIPNGDELNLLSSDMSSIENSMNGNKIEPVNLAENYALKTGSTQQPKSALDTGNPETKQIPAESATPPPPSPPSKKRTVLTIFTTSASDEDYDYDDSEHKCDDSDVYMTSVASVHQKRTTVTTADKELVSSDDYEGTSVVGDHGGDGVDVGDDSNDVVNDRMAATNFDGVEPIAINTQDRIEIMNEAPNQILPSLSPELLLPLDNSNRSTEVSISNTNDVREQVNESLQVISKSKDLWHEDFDEAAVPAQDIDDDDDDESSDTLSGLVNSSNDHIHNSPVTAGYFPHSASPKISVNSNGNILAESCSIQTESLPMPTMKKRFVVPPPSSQLNESYEDEFPSDIIESRRYSSTSTRLRQKLSCEVPQNAVTEGMNDIDASPSTPSSPSLQFFGPLQDHSRASNLISSIDAFEASFQTSFPESFTQKENPSTSSPSVATTLFSNGATSNDDLFIANVSISNSTNGFDNVASNEIILPQDEDLKTRIGALQDRDMVVLQSSHRRTGVENSNDVKQVISHLDASPKQSNIRKTDITSNSEKSARWLMEVKASTGKMKYKTDTSIDEASAQLTAVHIETAEEENKCVANGTSLDQLARTKSCVTASTDAKPQESKFAMQVSEPVFRQFPRTATPVKTIKHMPSSSSRINFMEDTFSTPISEKAPLLHGRASDEYSSPKSTTTQQKNNGSMRSRYLSTLSQPSSSFTAERGRISMSRRVLHNENNLQCSTPNDIAASAIGTKNHGSVEGRNLTVNVRERAAVYSKVSSPSVDASTNLDKDLSSSTANINPHNNRSNFRGASRSTVRLLEDEGDIPMQTSLSPRKFRNSDFSYSSRIDLEKQKDTEIDEGNATSAVEIVSEKRSNNSTKTNLLEQHDDRRTLNIDIGKQRRHINLSGRGRLSHKVDNEVARIYENGH